MTFAEAHEETRKLAAGSHFAVKVESTGYRNGTTEIDWSVYVDVHGWTKNYSTPAGALAEMRARVDGTWGEPVEATLADLEAIGAF